MPHPNPRFRPRRQNSIECLAPWKWPTREEYFDVFRPAIIATCRSVLNTSSPVRPWSDYFRTEDVDTTKSPRSVRQPPPPRNPDAVWPEIPRWHEYGLEELIRFQRWVEQYRHAARHEEQDYKRARMADRVLADVNERIWYLRTVAYRADVNARLDGTLP